MPARSSRFASLVLGVFVAGAFAGANVAAQGAGYPTRAVRFIVPFPPGGSADAIARILGTEMSRTFNQPVIVENRPGAGGVLGVDQAAKSPPDGYTIVLAAAGAVAINVSLMPKFPYDPVKDLAPITNLALIPMVAAASLASGIASPRELIAQAKARPGALAFGSAGNGTAMHLAGELFKLSTGTEIIHIPYRGSGPATTDVIAGNVPLGFVDLASALPHIRAGKVRALGTLGASRAASAPEIPTLAEQGIAGYDAVGWFGVAGPAGMPREAIARLNAEINRVMKLPEVRDRSIALGAEPATGTPEAFAAFIRAEIPKWARVIKASGARLD